MDWSSILYDVLKIVTTVLCGVITYYFIPYIKSQTSEKDRKELVYWTQLAVKIAESVYQEKGQGKFKKQYVIDWLNKNGIKFTEEQLNSLIDGIVSYFNATDWNKNFIEN